MVQRAYTHLSQQPKTQYLTVRRLILELSEDLLKHAAVNDLLGKLPVDGNRADVHKLIDALPAQLRENDEIIRLRIRIPYARLDGEIGSLDLIRRLPAETRVDRVKTLIKSLPSKHRRSCLEAVLRTKLTKQEVTDIIRLVVFDVPCEVLKAKTFEKTKFEHHIWSYVLTVMFEGTTYIAMSRWHDPLNGLTERKRNAMIKLANTPRQQLEDRILKMSEEECLAWDALQHR